MIKLAKKESEFKDRKQFLVALAVKFIQTHSGYSGIDDELFYDDAKCDGGALELDLMYEFDIEDEDIEIDFLN